MRITRSQSGFTVLEVLIGLAILSVVSTSIYFSYSNVLEIVQAAQYTDAALSIMESRVEVTRNMRYEDVGVLGGSPAGKLQQSETVALGTSQFTLHSYVRNIDDPFDGSTPDDKNPADYKLVQFELICDSCTRYRTLSMSTYVAPKNLEAPSRGGSLFINVLDGSGIAVSGATVHVTNTAVSPTVDFTDTTDNEGLLKLVDTATSSAGYHIVVSKSGYSTSQTYPPGNPANPLQPDVTVATQQLTIATLSIDRVGQLTVSAKDPFCKAAQGFDVLITGAKLIGTLPDVPKYSELQSTDANGAYVNNAVEWDTYSVQPKDDALDIAGSQQPLTFSIDPGETHLTTLMVAPRVLGGLSVSVTDPNGSLLNDAVVHVTKIGYDKASTTGSWTLQQSDWSSGEYSDKSPLLDTASPGQLSLVGVDGVYASGSQQWLISNTYDLGTTDATITSLNWSPASQPPQTGNQSLMFQLAANNDDATWSWVGPDGTETSFFTSPGQIPTTALNGKRYLRYRVYLSTESEAHTPTLEDVFIGFSSGCIPTGQAYVNGMEAGTYTITVTRSGYQEYTTTVTTDGTWQRIEISLTP